MPSSWTSTSLLPHDADRRRRPRGAARQPRGDDGERLSLFGVDDTFTTEVFGRRHHETEELYAANPLGRVARSLGTRTLGRSRAKLLRSKAPDRLLRPLLFRPEVPRITLDPGLRTRLEDYFKEDVDRLRKLTGQRFETCAV